MTDVAKAGDGEYLSMAAAGEFPDTMEEKYEALYKLMRSFVGRVESAALYTIFDDTWDLQQAIILLVRKAEQDLETLRYGDE